MCGTGRYCLKEKVTNMIVKKHQYLRAFLSIINDAPIMTAMLLCATELPLAVVNYTWSISEAPIWIIMLGIETLDPNPNP